jgi:predicted ATPase
MGVHSGPAELRDGDYYGTPVNRAARVAGAAHGGQIVVSHATRELLADDHVELLDLGEHSLRDLGRRERIFQVIHPELERDFAPLASLAAFSGNLPVQVTSFVGREADVARVVEVLDEARLVTLAGTGGVGKTRLAVQVAAEVLPQHPDGAWMCELAAASDADSMAQIVASTLGCLQHPGLSLAASIVEYLKVRELLLVLDNCEHLLDDAGDLADAVVQACPGVTVLATSREALDVPGEHVVRVRSLPTPRRDADEVELVMSPSVSLFCDRARDAGADMDWDRRQWMAVAEVCQRVDGIPLAIELAAARAVSMNPIDVAGHLDERFRLLTGSRRGRVERHQTLRATVEWSYQLLGAAERAIFDCLGTFAGSFDAAGVMAVASGEGLDAWTVTDALGSLVAKSMVNTDTGPAGTTRYTMLETLRQFAREQLDEAGDTDRCRRRMAEHLGKLAHDAAIGVMGSEDAAWLARLRSDIDNVRAAIAWALDSDEPADQQIGLAILSPLGWIGQNCSDLRVDAFAARALPLVDRAPPDLRTPVLALAAFHYWQQGEMDRAIELCEWAVADGIVPTLITPLDPYVMLIAVLMTKGDHARAFEAMEDARRYFDALESQTDVARILGGMATFEAMAGRVDAALADSARALQLAEGAGNQQFLANVLNGRAWALQRDDPEQALAVAERFLEIYRRTGVARSVVPGLTSLAAGLRSRLGDDQGALPLLLEALTIARDDGASPAAVATLGFALKPLCRVGHPDAAAVLIGAMERGALVEMAGFPGAAEGRARSLVRVRDALGDGRTDALVERGASMSYDDVIRYAVEQLSASL